MHILSGRAIKLHNLFVALLLIMSLHVTESTKVDDDLPHIIFILADDLGYNDVGWAKDDYAGLTPTLDALKKEAIELTEYYTQQLCTPARAALLTGRYPYKTGVQAEPISIMSKWGLPIQYELLPEYLAEVGYESHGIGKWHLGHAYERYLPHHRGFMSFYGFLAAEEHYFSHRYTTGKKSYLDLMELWSTSDTSYVDRNGNAAEKGWSCITDMDGIYSSKFYTDRAIDIANQWSTNGGKKSNTPLFLYVAYQNPHSPIEPNNTMDYSKVKDILDKITDTPRLGNAKLVYNLDHEVNRLMAGLEKAGVLDNYILVFTSDNGPCKVSGGSAYPLRGGKGYTYEGGSKNRAFIKSPLLTNTKKNEEYSGMFHVTDWLPTLMDAVSPRWSKTNKALDLDGVSHWAALLSGSSSSSLRNEILYNLQKNDYSDTDSVLYGAIRVGDWKLVLNEDCQLWLDFGHRYNSDEYLTQCDDQSKACTVSTDAKSYLFNLANDPYEMVDLKSEYVHHFSALKKRLEEHKPYIKTPISELGMSSSDEFEKGYNNFGCVVPWLDS